MLPRDAELCAIRTGDDVQVKLSVAVFFFLLSFLCIGREQRKATGNSGDLNVDVV
jgi:hypothetical protein